MYKANCGEAAVAVETVIDGCGYSTHDYQEMVALLQEEVARLEQELQMHEARTWATKSIEVPSPDDEGASSTPSDSATAALGEVERLNSELVNRDETVAFLLDQLTLLEEAKAAARVEWEHLTEWVAELEQRVEGQDPDAFRELRSRMEVREREAEALRTKLEEDRRGWEVQRRVYEDEIARIHGGVAQARASALAGRDMVGDIDGGLCADPDAIKAVEQENLRLRVAHEMVERTAAENSTVLREKLSEIQDEFDVLRNRLLQVDDERRRERLDYDTTITDLRTKLSQTSLAERQAPQPVVKPERSTEAMDSELRIRALKQHLREIHEREETERRERSLKHRLSRIWSRTTPP